MNDSGGDKQSVPSFGDLALLTLIQQRDTQAMVVFFDRHSKLVYSVALRVLSDPAAAEDVLQEVFLQLWQGRFYFDPDKFGKDSLVPWLATISRNRAIDVVRGKRCHDPIETVALASLEDTSAICERNLMLAKANLFIQQLKPEQITLLHLAFDQELTHSEVAAKTGMPLGTVKTRIRRALQSLRAMAGEMNEC
jgi:RNA polymerase sigma-70 factor (ECF subfamily)